MRIGQRVFSALVALVAGIAGRGLATAGIVVNGGFETGDFTGWTLSGNTDFTGVATGIANSGDYAAYFGPDGSLGYLSQTLATTAGTNYELTFFLAERRPDAERSPGLLRGNDLRREQRVGLRLLLDVAHVDGHELINTPAIRVP